MLGEDLVVPNSVRLPRSAISRYVKKIAQMISGDVDLRLTLQVDNEQLDVWIIRLTPGYVQVVLYITAYNPQLRQEELEKLKPLSVACPTLYDVLSERAGAVLEIRYFLCNNVNKFYVWARSREYVRLALPLMKNLYHMLKKYLTILRCAR